MFAELSSTITTGRKLLKSDRETVSTLLFASILGCYIIIQMDLESLILAYMSTGAYLLVLCREQTFPKKTFSVDVCHRLWWCGEGPGKSKPHIEQEKGQQYRTNYIPAFESDESTCFDLVLNARRSPQVQTSHLFELRDCKDCLAAAEADNEHLDDVEAGFSSAAAYGVLLSRLDPTTKSGKEAREVKSELAWPLEPQETDDQCQSWLELNACELKEDDQGHSLLDLNQYQYQSKEDSAFEDPAFEEPEMNKVPVAELADGQLGLPSLGAKFHPEECIPCKFLVSRNGCKDGEACVYCHAPHPELNQGQRRRLMSRINRKKRQDAMLNGICPQNDATHDHTLLVEYLE